MTGPQPPNRWPAAVVALAVVFLAGLGFSLYWGITRTSQVSDPAYYTRGRGYGDRLRAEQAAGNWHLELEHRGEEFILRLADGDGAPLSGLRGKLTVLAADGTDASHHELEPGGSSGEYRAALPVVPADGARAVVELGDGSAVIRRTLLLTP